MNDKKEIVNNLINQKVSKKHTKELTDLLLKTPTSIDTDKAEEDNMTFGDKVADKLTEIAGSWRFIISFSLFLFSWIIFNGFIIKNSIDPFPFILLNLMLSCLAALQAPIIMMSQNRQTKKDSLRTKNDYKTDLKSELILEEIYSKIDILLKKQAKLEKELSKKK